MAVRGTDTVIDRMLYWQDKTVALMETRLAILCGMLKLWARTEHRWQPRRPHTEGTIDAFITEVGPLLMRARLEVDQDAGLWLEFDHSGKYAWLWAVILNHAEDVAGILGGDVSRVIIEANPNLREEKIEALVRAELLRDPNGRG